MRKTKLKFVILLSIIFFWGAGHIHAEDVPSPSPDTTPPVITLAGDNPYEITVSSIYSDPGATAIDDTDGDIAPIASGTVDTAVAGTYMIIYTATDLSGNVATLTRTVNVIEEITQDPDKAVFIRNGATILYDDTVPLPPPGTVTITDIAGTDHQVDARSVLGLIYAIGQSSSSFSISIKDFGFGLYLYCLTPTGGTEACNNWQYTINHTLPSTAIDQTLLSESDPETLGLYFGSPQRVTFDQTTVTAGDSIIATAEKYDYEEDVWSPLVGATIAATIPDPTFVNPPTVKVQSITNTEGETTLTIADPGTYETGILTHTDFGDYVEFPPTIITVTADTSGGDNSGGGSSASSFSVPDAVTYLKNVQSSDGSFKDNELYTDWAAIAYAAADVGGSARSSLLGYLESHNSISSLLTDNERRAMALLALDKDPYNFKGVNYIEAILDEFDSESGQFGDRDLVNDDIFALIPLANAGYDEDDNIIVKTIEFILSEQKANGSWEGSVDITAAAIQALKPFESVDGVSDALADAETYLINSQDADGGWGNISSTSWALQAESALNTSWTKNGKDGFDYLAAKQTEANNGGAVLPATESVENVIWGTSYAIPAGLGAAWSEILESVSRPKEDDKDSEEESSIEEEVKDEAVLSDSLPLSAAITLADSVPVYTPAPSREPAFAPTSNDSNNEPETESVADTKANEDVLDETSSHALTAAIIDAEEASSIPRNILIVFGGTAGLFVLYFILKNIFGLFL